MCTNVGTEVITFTYFLSLWDRFAAKCVLYNNTEQDRSETTRHRVSFD